MSDPNSEDRESYSFLDITLAPEHEGVFQARREEAKNELGALPGEANPLLGFTLAVELDILDELLEKKELNGFSFSIELIQRYNGEGLLIPCDEVREGGPTRIQVRIGQDWFPLSYWFNITDVLREDVDLTELETFLTIYEALLQKIKGLMDTL